MHTPPTIYKSLISPDASAPIISTNLKPILHTLETDNQNARWAVVLLGKDVAAARQW